MIIRNPNRERYTIIDKTGLEDGRLSFKARGLLAFLLSKTDGWEVYTAYLVKSSERDGRDSIIAGLKELEKNGYIRRDRGRKSDGTWDGTDVKVFEAPQPENPVTDTATGKSGAGKSGAGKSAQSEDLIEVNTDLKKNLASASPPPVDNLRAAMIDACGWDPEEKLTSSSTGWLNKALLELRTIGATPEQIHQRSAQYRIIFPKSKLTPTALAKHWAELRSDWEQRVEIRDAANGTVEEECRRLGAESAHKDRAWLEDRLATRRLTEEQRDWARRAWEDGQLPASAS
jgi:hypothetical protein